MTVVNMCVWQKQPREFDYYRFDVYLTVLKIGYMYYVKNRHYGME